MSRLFVLLLIFSFSYFEWGCMKDPSSPTSVDIPKKEEKPEEIIVDIIPFETNEEWLEEITIDEIILHEFGEVYVVIHFGKFLEESEYSGTLGKRLANEFSDRVVYKIEKLSLAQFKFTNLIKKTSDSSSYPIDSTGKCLVEKIIIPSGYPYLVSVDFFGTTMCPWFPDDSSYSLTNNYFSGFDTIDLETKSKDTLILDLLENQYAMYFVSIENPQGKYTEGKMYSVVEDWNTTGVEVEAIYSNNRLNHRIYCGNSDTALEFTLRDDTGEVSFPFPFVINSVIDNDIIEVTLEADTGDVSGEDSGTVYIGTISFERLIPLKMTGIIQENGGIVIYFNRSGKISMDDSTRLRIELDGDTANIAQSGKVEGLSGRVNWAPDSTLAAGTYTVEAKGFLDEFGGRTPLFKEEFSIP